MQLPRIASHAEATAAIFVAFALLPATTAMFDCRNFVVNRQKFDLSPLGKPHSVVTTMDTPPTVTNTSYTVDICHALKRKGDVPMKDQCPGGTNGVHSPEGFSTQFP
jgi:autophagy-related protein 27